MMFGWFRKKYQGRSLMLYLPASRSRHLYQLLQSVFEEGCVQLLNEESYKKMLLNPFNRLYVCDLPYSKLKVKALWLEKKHYVPILFHPTDLIMAEYEQRHQAMKSGLKDDVLFREMEVKLFRNAAEFARHQSSDKEWFQSLQGSKAVDFAACIRMDANLLREDARRLCQEQRIDSSLQSVLQKIMLKPKNMDPNIVQQFQSDWAEEFAAYQLLVQEPAVKSKS